MPGLVLNESVTPIIKKITKEPPIYIDPQDLGGSSAAGKKFTMGVRLRSSDVSI